MTQLIIGLAVALTPVTISAAAKSMQNSRSDRKLNLLLAAVAAALIGMALIMPGDW